MYALVTLSSVTKDVRFDVTLTFGNGVQSLILDILGVCRALFGLMRRSSLSEQNKPVSPKDRHMKDTACRAS